MVPKEQHTREASGGVCILDSLSLMYQTAAADDDDHGCNHHPLPYRHRQLSPF